MQRSIFGKYFIIFLSVILVSIVILGTMIIFLASQYFRNSQHNLLLSYAKNSSKIVQENLSSNNYMYVESTVIYSSFNILTRPSQVDIVLYDIYGKPVIASGANKQNLLAYNIPQDILEKTLTEGTYKGVSSMNGIYDKPYYIVTFPVYNNVGHINSFIMASINTNETNRFLFDMLRIFSISACVVIILSTIAIYLLTNKIVRPLREMSMASRDFAKGDFTQKINVNTFDEVGQLANSLNNMASSLSVNEEMRRSFVANVSHELKTPMTTISGFVDGILDGTIPQKEEKKYLSIVSSEVKRLSRLVVSMLNIAKIEAGEMKLQVTEFNIMDIIYSTVFSMENKINEKNLDIIGLDVGKFMVLADMDLLHQVVYNLVENAIKFSNNGGFIEFNVYQGKGITFISIKNSGEGIDDEYKDKIFDRFYKMDESRSLDKNGVGLGLYIVKSIINMHDGDIVVNSEQGKFCEFIFNIHSSKSEK